MTLISYQGIPCRSARVSYARGYAPGTASVVIWVEDWPEGFQLSPALRPASAEMQEGEQQAQRTVPEDSALVRVGPGRVLDSEGLLVLEEPGVSRWSRRMLVLRAETHETGGANSTQLVRLLLVDERALWQRGMILRWSFNRLRADGTVAPDSAGEDERLLSRREIVDEVARSLPRRPELVVAPEDWEGDTPSVELQPYQTSAGALAEIADPLLDVTEPCLHLDGRLAFHKVGDGFLGYAPQGLGVNSEEFPPELVIHDSAKDVAEWGYPDDAVLVVGGPRVATVALDAWEPVLILPPGGEARSPGVKPLSDETLLALTGVPELNMEWLSWYVLAPPSYQGHPQLDGVTAQLLADQAWRIYRMPGVVEVDADGLEGPGRNAHLLPMLDRAEVGPEGRREPPLVETYSYGMHHVLADDLGALSPLEANRRASQAAIARLWELLGGQQQVVRPNALPFGSPVEVSDFDDPLDFLGGLFGLSGDVRDELVREDRAALAGEEARTGELNLNDALTPEQQAGLPLDRVNRAIELARRINKARTTGESGGVIAQQIEQELSRLFQAEAGLGNPGGQEVYDFAQEFLALEETAKGDRGALELPEDVARRLGAAEALAISAARLVESLAGEERSATAPARSARKTVAVLHNFERQQDTGWAWESRERGLIALARLPGWLADLDVPRPDSTSFVPKPVRVSFGATLRPRVDQPLTQRVETGAEDSGLADVVPEVLTDRESLYRSAWRREGTVPVQVTPEELEEIAEQVTPVHDPTLVELVPIEGPRNLQALGEAAFALVAPRMARPELSRTREVTVAGPWPVQPDGVVAAVVVESAEEDGAPCGFLTTVHSGEAPPTPAASQTRERPPGDVKRFARPDRREGHS